MRVNYSREEIMSGLASGDEKSENRFMTYLYNEYYGLIESFVMKNSGTKDDACDVFQDSLIVLYHKANDGGFELSCSVKTYLYSVSRNLWMDKLRQNSNRARLLDDHEFEKVQESDMNVLLENERSEIVASLLKELGDKCRSVLTLFYYHKKSMKEIAGTLEMASEAVARNKKHACLKKFRDMIGENESLKQLLYF
ncbi:RNA polymerase sigma factor [Roseivirga sp. BDSF3-8]|uniref:RNA polymerase sigma factor n=1 Tax=Roseivirga sp. BDSF3-8 TaxID=3241598 RepID=UPI003531B1B4